MPPPTFESLERSPKKMEEFVGAISEKVTAKRKKEKEQWKADKFNREAKDEISLVNKH